MAARASGEWLFDSAIAPSPRPAGPTKNVRTPDNSTVELAVDDGIVALSLGQPMLDEVGAALACTDLMVVGEIGVENAALVIADVACDVRERVASLRKRMRPDAALILVSPVASAEVVRLTHEAGALACLRPPVVMEEVLSFVRSALDSRAAKSQAADLARKLDLEAHLASIGRISAGLSHEISTPLLVAQTNLESIRDDCGRLMQVAARVSPDLVELEELPRILAETQRAHDRLRAVLEMMRELVGRRRASNAERIDLLRVAEDTKILLAPELADVDTTTLGRPVFAVADAILLGQIMQNLVANAAQAARTLSSPCVRIHAYAHGDRAILSVRDNGPGIPAELHDKIFEPFYTTRRGRGGIGLGLALCREYAVQMNAEISLWSLPGRGACFRLSLPRT